ncbi:hypothetical protein SEA_KEITABEAR_9 [Gordonia phage Keitabear]|uniref:Uncharacterized protein n=1 Tax=Gordonia phage Keitabear TaxID=2653274 RepID=A0A5P8D6V7_9CAUD|nr:hypothetical protein KNU77_gp09 [Gordonia phage Keitabear]QFP94451.1 hypothetical protein SEA_KEITABEAR_9 [Gordonia phage Keitabear]
MSFTDSDLDPTLDAAYAEIAAEHVVDGHFDRIMRSVFMTGPGVWMRAGILDTARNHDLDPAVYAATIKHYAERARQRGDVRHDYDRILHNLAHTDLTFDPAEVAFDDGTRAVWDDTVRGWQFVGDPIAIAR